MDIQNITALSFVKVINKCVNKYLGGTKDFSSFMRKVKQEISSELSSLISELNNIYLEPSPFQSLLMNDCVEKAVDISLGNRYNNYGIHGTGISSAVDSLAAKGLVQVRQCTICGM
jgi:pyruvate-formate lyase